MTNAAGTIKFFLNETATSVKVVFDNNTVTNDLTSLGQTNVGVNSFSLGAHTNYSIIVSKVGTGVSSQLSPTPTAGNSSTNLDYYGPRGVAVNQNAKGPNFGRIYVVNSFPATHLRTVGKGVYALNPDYSDALGQGTNALPTAANFPGGTNQLWGSSTTYGPYRISVGKDDKVYVADSSGSGTTAGAPVWMIDPNLTTPIAMFAYSGLLNGNSGNAGPCQSEPFITGSLATGDLNLTCLMWNFYATNTPGAGYQAVLRYSIGSGPIDNTHVWTGLPTVLTTNTQPNISAYPGFNGLACDVAVGSNGYVYVSYPRATQGGMAVGGNNLWVYDNQVPANLLWASSDPATGGVSISGGAATNDCFVAKTINLSGIAISPDNKYLLFGNAAAANFVTVTLTNGVPDVSTITKYTAPNAINRSVAFDAADNVYTVEGNSDSLRAYSLGLTTTCTTYNDITGTNGSFNMVIPNTAVSVTASTNVVWQNSATPVVLQLTRAGQNLNLPLTVSFNLGGSATNYPGEYTVLPAGITPSTNNTITFAANVTTTNITITPVADNVARPITTITLTIAGGAGYAVGSPASTTITLVNTATPVISVTNLDAQMYEETNDFARFKVSRLGDTNVDLTGAVNLTFGGTAQSGRDFYPAGTVVDLPPGILSTNIQVFPIHNGLVTGPLTVTATAATGSGYTPSATSGTITIVDSDYAPETILWSDALTNDTSANWKQSFATTNGAPYDATIAWGFDYSQLAVPPSPHGNGNTYGLYMTVNKNDALPVAAALNFYPIGQSFSGNYAFRFDMFLIENDTTSTTEYALFGVNHSGSLTNWFRNSAGGVPAGTTFDGIFCDVESDGAALGDYADYSAPTTAGNNPTGLSATSASTLTGIFKAPPWTVGGEGGGVAANVYGSSTPMWAAVEVAQVGNLITLKINQTVIFTTTNTTAFTSGDVMLGYEDGYDSIGSNGGSVIYANARVVRLASATKPVITKIVVSGGNAVITFTADSSDTANLFTLQSAATVNGTYSDTAATITSPNSGVFQATIAVSGPTQFYRVKRN